VVHGLENSGPGAYFLPFQGTDLMRTSTVLTRNRAGFSLIEAMIVVVVLGLMLAIATPRIGQSLVYTNVRNARSATVNLYARARIVALQTRKPATLNFNAGNAWITVPNGALTDTIGAVTNLTGEYGVTVAPTGNVTVLPTGLVNALVPIKVVFTKNSHSDSLTISGYGRIQ